jgi:hypothetical protein
MAIVKKRKDEVDVLFVKHLQRSRPRQNTAKNSSLRHTSSHKRHIGILNATHPRPALHQRHYGVRYIFFLFHASSDHDMFSGYNPGVA